MVLLSGMMFDWLIGCQSVLSLVCAENKDIVPVSDLVHIDEALSVKTFSLSASYLKQKINPYLHVSAPHARPRHVGQSEAKKKKTTRNNDAVQ